jgi:hypothetical protein
MTVSKIRDVGNGRSIFNLNVGGFCIRNCKWKRKSNQVTFPVRRNRLGQWQLVIKAHGRYVRVLQQLLVTGRSRSPRDRRPCKLAIHRLRQRGGGWYIFEFTVRGFTVCNSRWQPRSGAIHLPVTFLGPFNKQGITKRVVTAYGVHVNRLRTALIQHARNTGRFDEWDMRYWYGWPTDSQELKPALTYYLRSIAILHIYPPFTPILAAPNWINSSPGNYL